MACTVEDGMGVGTLEYLANFAVDGSLLTDMPQAGLTCVPGSFKASCMTEVTVGGSDME